jgi:hypothetical protein
MARGGDYKPLSSRDEPGGDEPFAKGAAAADDPDGEEDELPPPSWAHLGSTSALSRLFFHWITPLILLGKKRQINQDDLPPLEAGLLHSQHLHVEPLIARLRERQAKLGPKSTLIRAMMEVFRADLVKAWLLAVTEQTCNLAASGWLLQVRQPDGWSIICLK